MGVIPDHIVDSSLKIGLESTTKVLALGFEPYGVRVNSIGLNYIEAPPAQPEKNEYVLSKIDLGRIGQVDDILGAIVFLASNASALTAGTALLIDGGWPTGSMRVRC